MSEEFNPQRQHEVQRQLGRCLVRLQQYERLLKSMFGLHRFGGPADELEAMAAENAKRLGGQTLGQLVGALFDTYVVAEGPVRPVLDDSKVPSDRVAMSFQFEMQMDEERLASTKAALAELVRLRNDLVHHFIDRFELWTNEGCSAALEHLQDCYERIERHYVELREWALNMDKAREVAAAWFQSPAFHDLLVGGTSRDGAVQWAVADIVQVLREALVQNGESGWLRLEAAQAWMAQHHPEQTPERYGCRSWPQVLDFSGAFQLEYRLEGGRKVAWFRVRR